MGYFIWAVYWWVFDLLSQSGELKGERKLGFLYLLGIGGAGVFPRDRWFDSIEMDGVLKVKGVTPNSG